MRSLEQDEARRVAEFVAQRSEAIFHLKEKLGEEFAKSAEGKEAIFLGDVLHHYISKLENFFAHFISGETGKRGIDVLIGGLEHPESEINKDKELIEKLKKLAGEEEKAIPLHWDQYSYYSWIRKKVQELRPMSDIHRFISEFNGLMVKTCKYEHTQVAQIIKRKSEKEMPCIITLENFEFAIAAWKYIFAHLYRPDQEAKAKEVLGSHEMEGFEEKIAAKLKVNVDAVKEEEKKCFPETKEDSNMTNMMTFAKAITSEGKKNIFIRLLIAAGQERFAVQFMSEFGKKGKEKTDPRTIERLASLIMKLDNESARENVELAARDELAKHLTRMLDAAKTAVAKEQERFKKIIASRIHDLKHKHAKKLEAISEMHEQLSNTNEDILLAAESKRTIMEKISSLEKARDEHFNRSLEIISILKAMVLMKQFLASSINKEKFDDEMREIRSKKPPQYALDAIEDVSNLVQRFLSNDIKQEEFDRQIKARDEYTEKLNSQLTTLLDRQAEIADNVLNLVKELEDVQYVIDFSLEQANEMAMDDIRRLKRLGVDVERFTAQQNQIQGMAPPPLPRDRGAQQVPQAQLQQDNAIRRAA